LKLLLRPICTNTPDVGETSGPGGQAAWHESPRRSIPTGAMLSRIAS